MRSMRATPASAAMEWNIIGLPPTGMYCLGTASPKRAPCPAAGTIAKTLGMARSVLVVPAAGHVGRGASLSLKL